MTATRFTEADVRRAVKGAMAARENPQSEYIRASRVAERFPISTDTLIRWEKRGLIVIHRPSSRMSLVKCSDLERAIEGMKP